MDIEDVADSIDDLAQTLECEPDLIIHALRNAELIDDAEFEELNEAMEI